MLQVELLIIWVKKQEKETEKEKQIQTQSNTTLGGGIPAIDAIVRSIELNSTRVYVCGVFHFQTLSFNFSNVAYFEMGVWNEMKNGVNGECFVMAFHPGTNRLFIGG